MWASLSFLICFCGYNTARAVMPLGSSLTQDCLFRTIFFERRELDEPGRDSGLCKTGRLAASDAHRKLVLSVCSAPPKEALTGAEGSLGDTLLSIPTGPSCSRIQVGQRNPTMLRMVLEALRAREKRQGTSVVAIKVYIQHKYPTVDTTRFKYLLKQALETGVRRGLLTRPANSKAKGATGSFKVS